MWIKRLTVLLLLTLIVVLAGCDGLDNMGGRTVGLGDHSIQFVNNTNMRICYIYASPSSSSSWGADWLGDTGVINANESFTIRIMISDVYDLMAVLESTSGECDGNGQQITNTGFKIEGDQTWSVTTE